MPEWLSAEGSQVDSAVLTLGVRIGLAWLAGIAVALIARRGCSPGEGRQLSITLILMSILIAMATQIIGDNIARAFSLVGALSIVRFRTAVPETRDVAFVLAAVVVGMAIGAGQYWVCIVGLFVVWLATQLATLRDSKPSTVNAESANTAEQWRFVLQVGLHSFGSWEETFAKGCESFKLQSAATVRKGSALELVYACTIKPSFQPSTLVSELNSLPNIESAAAKRI